MNVGRYLRGEDLHVGTSRITKPKELKMNERIKELALQAELNLELQSLKVEKFAELIIRECADIALKKGMASPDTDFRTGSILLNTYLLGRFGVEE